jgi:hypothetical protein
MGPAVAHPRLSLEELLLRHGAIDQAQLARAREEKEKWGGDLGRILVDLGYVSENLLLRAQAHQLGIAAVDPEAHLPTDELIQALPVHLCERYGVIPVSGDLAARLLRVATSAPADVEQLALLAHDSGFRIEPLAATSSAIERAIRRAYYGEAANDHPLAEIEPETEGAHLHDLEDRVARLEKLLTHKQFAALLARVERLEQIAELDRRALRVLTEVILDLGFLTAEELKARLAK